MSANEMERVRHASEKGAILRVLQEAYGGPAVLMGSLVGVLDSLGYPMSQVGLQFALTYLAESGYVRVMRARDLPGWRADRAQEVRPDTIMSAALTPLGLRLIDGTAAVDPQVRF